jgi:hypothetical protein
MSDSNRPVRRVSEALNGLVRNRDGNIIDTGFNIIGIRPQPPIWGSALR